MTVSDLDPGLTDLAAGRHGDPFALLGMHGAGSQLVVRTMQPGARSVSVIEALSGNAAAALPMLHPDGLFGGPIGRRRKPFPYRLRIVWGDGQEQVIEDPYRFPPVLSDYDIYLLAEGTHHRAYQQFGAHPHAMDGVGGVRFAVWAPNASRVSVVGDFNSWDGRRHPMRRRREAGIWELFIPGLDIGTLYKYELLGPGGNLLPLKSDPYGFAAEHPPRTASVVCGLERPAEAAARRRGQSRDQPIAIYEVHLGSWKRHLDNSYLSYRELADDLVPYVRTMGFTHIELLPVSEHPFDGSWGYQPIGLYAPTSRFGSPADFHHFVERCHAAELGVILDWVPGHFPNDAHGLGEFDGTALYEHADPRQGRHLEWNTFIFNYGRHEVANYLLSNALYWFDRFDIDGLRVDAVASMLYRDYSRPSGEWIPNEHGGRENWEAVRFLRRMNELVFGEYPEATTIAEESTTWPMVSQPISSGGLGFGFKWNMGWMHDTLRYMSKEPIYRKWHHDDLTFGLVYAYSENFVLPLSHDEVVHGKGSLIGKMPGDRWQKFANLRAYFGFMYTHPGKKLLFMGGEFAQEREWNHDRSLDWHLLDDAMHSGMQRLIRDLNALYRGTPALYQLDAEPAGFEWLVSDDRDQSVLVYLRRGRDGSPVLVTCNFTPEVRAGYRVGVPEPGFYAERLNTDSQHYGGSNVGNGSGVASQPEPHNGRPHSLALTLPPLATVVLECR